MVKKLIVTLCLCLQCLATQAGNRPEAIPSRLLEIRSQDWYLEKLNEWKVYLNKHTQDVEGWWQYFQAALYADISPEMLSNIAGEIHQHFPETYLADYTRAKLLGWTEVGIEAFRSAFQETSEAPILMADRLMLAEVLGRPAKRRQLAQQLFDQKIIYPSLLSYSYNVLSSVTEQGILVVQGESTTVPIWLLQDVMGLRRDVKVLNLDLAENAAYLKEWLSRYSLKGQELLANTGLKEVLRKLPELNTEVGFFYGLTLPLHQINALEERLYVVGLASFYSPQEFEQYDVLKENIERKFLLDYLTIDFNGEPKTATGQVYASNYILPFLLLKEYYEELGDAPSSQKWEDLILQLAERSKIKDRILPLLKRNTPETTREFAFTEIDVKALDEKMVNIRDSLYASQAELSNQEYWFYLDYLRKNEYQDLYEQSRVDWAEYDDLTKALLGNYHYSPVNMEAIYAKKEKDKNKERFLEHPALDMSYAAALAYCEWLTVQYNQQADRKFKKVRFRLPSRKEWTIAAFGQPDFTSWNLEENTVHARESENWKGSRKDNEKFYSLTEYKVSYPWWIAFSLRNDVKNALGCYLANVKVPDEISCPAGVKGDGFTFTSPINSYFPNGLGLHDVVGNVAEMINEEGKAMGGSWNHPAEECTITSVNTYDGSDPAVGFRLFMEVIEE